MPSPAWLFFSLEAAKLVTDMIAPAVITQVHHGGDKGEGRVRAGSNRWLLIEDGYTSVSNFSHGVPLDLSLCHVGWYYVRLGWLLLPPPQVQAHHYQFLAVQCFLRRWI